MSPRGAFALLAALRFGACHGSPTTPPGQVDPKPLDVAALAANCDGLEDCNDRCSMASPASCVSAGRLYEFAHGVPADPTRAFQLYERACEWKYGGGCYNEAVLLEAGKGVAKDLTRARELYAKVCTMGSQTSCAHARALGDKGAD